MRYLIVRVLSVAVFFCCLWLLQEYVAWLEFDRQKIISGEVWRLWTGHLVHTNSYHLMLNYLAAMIIYFTLIRGIKVGEVFLSSVIFSALISVALFYIYPYVDWYNGLSGLLHALAAYFCALSIRDKNKVFLVIFCFLWGKVLLEAIRSYFGYENLVGDMRVITEAHLAGVFIGTVSALIRLAICRVYESHSRDRSR